MYNRKKRMRDGSGRCSGVAIWSESRARSETNINLSVPSDLCRTILIAHLLGHLFLRHFRPHNFQRKHPAIAHQLSFITNRKASLPEEQPGRIFLAIFPRLPHDRRWWRRMDFGRCSLCGRRSRRGVTIHLFVRCRRFVLQWKIR